MFFCSFIIIFDNNENQGGIGYERYKGKINITSVRMKIIQLLVNGKRMTVQKFAERMEDVPQATLYRQLNKLLEAD